MIDVLTEQFKRLEYRCPYCKEKLAYFSGSQSSVACVIRVKHCKRDVYLRIQGGSIKEVLGDA